MEGISIVVKTPSHMKGSETARWFYTWQIKIHTLFQKLKQNVLKALLII